MQPKDISSSDFQIVDRYIAEVLRRFRDEHKDLAEAHEDIIHPIAALIDGDENEFLRYMSMCLQEWQPTVTPD